MKKKCLRISTALLILALMPSVVMAQVDNEAVYAIKTNEIVNWPQGPDLYSETGILMEAKTGEVLYDKGMNETRYPASITKVMTALLALENSDLEAEVTFTATALEGMQEGTNIGMQEGEVLTMEQCLQVMMIKSANEVANQIAEYVGGSSEGFAKMMNSKAAELGCTNTHFTNASGMPDENHYTTAYDMALIFRESLKNEKFRELISALSYTLEPTNKNAEARSFSNAHAVFVPNVAEHYPGCIGGKTGVTQVAKSTLVTGVERDGVTYIAVVMRAEDHAQVCADTSALFDYGYNNFKRINEEGGLVAPLDGIEDNLKASENEVLEGIETTYHWGDYLIGTETLPRDNEEEVEGETAIAEVDVPVTSEELEKETTKESNGIYRIVIITLGVLIGSGLILVIAGASKNKKRRKRR